MYGWSKDDLSLQWEPKSGLLDGHGSTQGCKGPLEYWSSRSTGSPLHTVLSSWGNSWPLLEANSHCPLAVTRLSAQNRLKAELPAGVSPAPHSQITLWHPVIQGSERTLHNFYQLLHFRFQNSSQVQRLDMGRGIIVSEPGTSRKADWEKQSWRLKGPRLSKSHFPHAHSARVLTRWYVFVRRYVLATLQLGKQRGICDKQYQRQTLLQNDINIFF